MAKEKTRVREYPGRNAHEAGVAFEADREVAASHGFEPTSQVWDGRALKVVYQPIGSASRLRAKPSLGTVLAVFGAAFMTFGVVLPWITVTDGSETLTLNGIQPFFDGNQDAFDGLIVLIAALVLALAGLRSKRVLAAIAALVGVGVGFLNLFMLRDRLDETIVASGFAGVEGDVGIGLWLVIAGGVLGLIGAIVMLSKPKSN